MDVKVCTECKKLFNYIYGKQLCPICRQKLEDKFQEVKNYLIDNKNAKFQDIVKDCDVSNKQLNQWIREERLEIIPGYINYCSKCGAEITTGKLCIICKNTLLNTLKNDDCSNNTLANKKQPKVKFHTSLK